MIFEYYTPYRYYYNGLDVTWYIMNDLEPPLGFRLDILDIIVR